LLLPLAFSCAPWLLYLALVSRTTGPSVLEGAFAWTALAGVGSFLVTGPLAAAQLRLAPREEKLGLVTYTIIYYIISAPTLTFQAIALSSSFLSGLLPGGLFVSNTARTVALTALLGAVAYAVFALVMNLAISRIERSTT
jgi:hypothetical protein